MKNSVKASVFFVVAVLAVFSGCQKNQNASNDGKVKITVWHSYVGSDQRAQYMENRMAQFRVENPDVVIDEQKMPRDQYQTRLKTQAAANSLPDGFILWPNAMTIEFANAGLIAPINDYLDQNPEWRDGLVSSALDQFNVNGKIYSVAQGISLTSIFFYNKALFDKYNVKVPTTYPELKTAVETFKQNGIIPIAHGDKNQWPTQSSVFSIVANRSTGSQWLTDALTKQNGAKFTDKVFTDALDIMKDLATSGALNSDWSTIDNVQSHAYFYREEAAMMIEGSWLLPELVSQAPEKIKPFIELSVFPAIPGGKGDPSTISGVASTGFVINSKASPEQKAVLLKLIKFLTDDASQKIFMDYDIPVSSVNVTPDLNKVTPFYAKLVTLIKEHPLVTVYDSALNSEQTEIVNNGLQSVMLGIQTPAAIAAELDKTVR
jgi:raffinose/stachyose/melibiose transport system substrate-binding protein